MLFDGFVFSKCFVVGFVAFVALMRIKSMLTNPHKVMENWDICNSIQNYFPISSSFSNNLTKPLISEHELDYSSSFLQDISSTIS